MGEQVFQEAAAGLILAEEGYVLSLKQAMHSLQLVLGQHEPVNLLLPSSTRHHHTTNQHFISHLLLLSLGESKTCGGVRNAEMRVLDRFLLLKHFLTSVA